ncbi:hypothetical protein [Geothrix sp. 21YS21S-2]|uniref:hypothetical protein n=1 Tax=Geothrix sp. 21YS21S-2 TaxID=3068893 RepID=UPI0027BAE5AD|nr:hypothetical protein [Geothrix sp. 21YS21S-2]
MSAGPPTTPDEVVQRFLDLLTSSPSRPAALQGADRILDHDLLPVAEEELPVLGVYLADDKFHSVLNDHGWDWRAAAVRVEIRAIGPMLAATAEIRNWVKTTVLQDDSLGGLVRSTTFMGFQPFGSPSNVRLAGADLDFESIYKDFTEQINE